MYGHRVVHRWLGSNHACGYCDNEFLTVGNIGLGDKWKEGDNMPGRRILYNGRHWCPECEKMTDFDRYSGQLGMGWCKECGWLDDFSKEIE